MPKTDTGLRARGSWRRARPGKSEWEERLRWPSPALRSAAPARWVQSEQNCRARGACSEAEELNARGWEAQEQQSSSWGTKCKENEPHCVLFVTDIEVWRLKSMDPGTALPSMVATAMCGHLCLNFN